MKLLDKSVLLEHGFIGGRTEMDKWPFAMEFLYATKKNETF